MCKELRRWVTSESDVILPCLNPLSQQWKTDQERGGNKKKTFITVNVSPVGGKKKKRDFKCPRRPSLTKQGAARQVSGFPTDHIKMPEGLKWVNLGVRCQNTRISGVLCLHVQRSWGDTGRHDRAQALHGEREICKLQAFKDKAVKL